MGIILSTLIQLRTLISIQRKEIQNLKNETKRVEKELRNEQRAQQLCQERKLKNEEKQWRQKLNQENQREMNKLKRELELKKMEYEHKESLEKIKDRKIQRQDTLVAKQEQNRHKRSMNALRLLKQNFEKVEEVDLNYSICTGQLIQGVANGTQLDSKVFQAVANKVPEQTAKLNHLMEAVASNAN